MYKISKIVASAWKIKIFSKNLLKFTKRSRRPRVSFSEYFVLLAAGGKPSTWFPPGGLVEHISDDQFLYKIQTTCWCKWCWFWGSLGECEFGQGPSECDYPALRVPPAETRLTVYRRLNILMTWGVFKLDFLKIQPFVWARNIFRG